MNNSQALEIVPPEDIIKVPVAITEPTVTDKESIELLKKQGLASVNTGTITSLGKLGVYIKASGVLRHQRGRAIVTQQWIDETIKLTVARMRHKTTEVKAFAMLADRVARLTRSMSESQRVSLEIEKVAADQSGVPIEESADIVPSFKPGSKVKPASGNTLVVGHEIHMHQNQPGTSTESPPQK